MWVGVRCRSGQSHGLPRVGGSDNVLGHCQMVADRRDGNVHGVQTVELFDAHPGTIGISHAVQGKGRDLHARAVQQDR